MASDSIAVNYVVDAYDVEQFAKVLKRYPDIARAVIKDTMASSVVYVISRIQPLTPVNTGALRNSISGFVEELTVIGSVGGVVRGIVESDMEYAQAVEMGTDPHWVPIEPLKRWAHLVLGDESAAYAVQAKIARVGTVGYGMFAFGWREAQPWVAARFDQALYKIVQKVAAENDH